MAPQGDTTTPTILEAQRSAVQGQGVTRQVLQVHHVLIYTYFSASDAPSTLAPRKKVGCIAQEVGAFPGQSLFIGCSFPMLSTCQMSKDYITASAAYVINGPVMSDRCKPGIDCSPLGRVRGSTLPHRQESFLQKIFGHLVIGNDTIGESIQERAIALVKDCHSPSLSAGKGLYQGVVA